MSKKDRIGEESINNFGSKMIIKEYRNATDIDVYFPEYNWIAKNKQYNNFKNGCVKCPYERRSYGIGYLGEGKYNTIDSAFQSYKHYKENLIKKLADKFHKYLPKSTYDALYKYEVEITD